MASLIIDVFFSTRYYYIHSTSHHHYLLFDFSFWLAIDFSMIACEAHIEVRIA